MKIVKMKRKIGIFLLILMGSLVFLYTQNNYVTKSGYQIESKRLPEKFNNFKIIHLSDLHSKDFGENQNSIARIVAKLKPNIIVITGDLVDSSHYDKDKSMELIRQSLKIAPVYFVTGNHEWWSGKYNELEKNLKEAGVHVLRNESHKIVLGGQSILIAGIDDPAQTQLRYYDEEIMASMLKRASTQEDGIFKILLSHRPEKFDDYVRYGFDIVFSGHAHGGQVRIPFVGGLVAPDQGFFPHYTSGLYKEKDTTMVVSRGLGNSIVPQRIFNRPQIVEVTLKTK